jgi:hypothetical protein
MNTLTVASIEHNQQLKEDTKMSDYMDKPSARWQQTVESLRELLEAEGLGSMERAYAEAVQKPWRERFIRQEKITQAGEVTQAEETHACIHRLWSPRCARYCVSNDLPGLDHVSLWKKDRTPVAFVSQPYFFPYDTMKETVAYCEAHGLEASVEANSWHFAGRTLLVTYRARPPR